MAGADPGPPGARGRLEHLDSLRGIAALAVALDHCMFAFREVPHPGFWGALLAWAPVNFFFILSGFVLTRSLARGGGMSPATTGAFYLRRVFRLYPAVLASLGVGGLMALAYSVPENVGASSEFIRRVIGDAILRPSSLHDLFNILTLQNIKWVPQLWTIRVEFLGSFVLPFLVWAVLRLPWLAVPMLVGLAFYKTYGVGDPANLFAFALGMAVHFSAPALHGLPARETRWGLALIAAAFLFGIDKGLHPVPDNILLALGLAILVPCNCPVLRGVLHSRPLVALGRLSYSIYLLHLPVLMLTWSLMSRWCPEVLGMRPSMGVAAGMFVATAAVTIPLAWVCERLVERPFNALGHRLAGGRTRPAAVPMPSGTHP